MGIATYKVQVAFCKKFDKVKVNFTMKILCCRIQFSCHLSSAGRATDL